MPRILITGPDTYTGDMLKVGAYYNAEPAESGTAAQNKAFHALIQEYWVSGCHSYNATTFEDFREFIKRDLGAGFSDYFYVDTEGRKRKSKEIPSDYMTYDGEKYVWGKLKSWADYTKRERMETIDRVIAEMHQAGVSSPKFQEILKGMEGIWE